ncbi:PadR family transcriptional regulator [Serpentinicella alkaliphila]|uniref:PadR family transcriptional regulator n=1 Tax=Serpentinicella alkaliphila TaxID=1734049 RepID=A0A4R2TI48_9FIRM|nr:helix-turn-helix transcriptional regulator [Serpentinicella alkaliphila]QUH25909.1 helix-turn-helix transcriptional regulator [Serpentinicella alkaliphila]TCQ01977.1 PadR family transcriptional regulator [Serpentinicella alkaliphila]
MKINKELIKGSTTMFILKLLSRGDMYGYQMIRELEEQSDNTFTLKEGTLYPILNLLESDGMIESYWEDTESARKRKYYKITNNGKKLLAEKEKEWEIYSNAVNKVIGGAGLA